MPMRPRIPITLSLASCLLALAGPASAGEQTWTGEALVSLAAGSSVGGGAAHVAELRLPAFDRTLGTLLEVRVHADIGLAGHAGVENLGPLPTQAMSEIWGLLSARRADGLPLGYQPFESQQAADLGAADGMVDFGGAGGASHLLAGAVALEGQASPDARWIGPPSEPHAEVRILLELEAAHVASGIGPLQTGLALQAEVELTLVYVYV